MATHSSVLAWRISGTGEPGGPPSMGSCRVGHDWGDLAAHIYRYPPLLRKVYFLPLHFYKRPTLLVPVFTNSKKFKDFPFYEKRWRESSASVCNKPLQRHSEPQTARAVPPSFFPATTLTISAMCHHSCDFSFQSDIPNQRDTFIVVAEPALTHHHP